MIPNQYLASSRAVNAATARCYQHSATGLWQVVTHTASSKQRSMLMVGDNDEMFTTRSINITSKTTEQYLIVCSDKSATIKDCDQCFVLLKLTTDRHEASYGLFATAEPLAV